MTPFSSVRVTSERAGRAPYNFVPLPGEQWKPQQAPPSGDRYHSDLLTGEVTIQLTLETDFYTRGMWTLVDFRKQPRETIQTLPYMVDGNVRMPGSSLRGMVRCLIEILSFSPLGEINNTQMFYRSVASSDTPGNARSFEPQAKTYKDRLLGEHQELIVRAGYLYGASMETARDHEKTNDDPYATPHWVIRPATIDGAAPGGWHRNWHRYRTREAWQRREVRFDVEGETRTAYIHERGREKGWLVCSGGIYGKQKQWVVREEDKSAALIKIPQELVDAYKENGVTKQIREAHFDYTEKSNGIPCFFVQDEEGIICGFGHTAYMRMPYRRRPREAVPPNTTKEDPREWDFAERLFGRLQNERHSGARGRIFFEDAFLTGVASLREKQSAVLGQPKPTTYQHYLVQKSEKIEKSLHWDGDLNSQGDVVLRGHKICWHRPGASWQSSQKDAATQFEPVKAGAVFNARIRFENLSKAELGALLCAIALPVGCSHKLGMGKPLGLGSVHIRLLATKLRTKERYAAFFTPDNRLVTGERIVPETECIDLLDAFAGEILADQSQALPGVKWSKLWSHPRIRELRALLTLEAGQRTQSWLNKTRNLEFGKPSERERNYNEYQEIGYPNSVRVSKRRPLPPATQVLRDPQLPADARPFK